MEIMVPDDISEFKQQAEEESEELMIIEAPIIDLPQLKRRLFVRFKKEKTATDEVLTDQEEHRFINVPK